MVNDLINILWFTADYFIDVDRQLVPFIRDCYGVNVRWIVLQSLNGAKVEPSSDYDIINYQYRGKDPRNLFALNSIYRKRLIGYLALHRVTAQCWQCACCTCSAQCQSLSRLGEMAAHGSKVYLSSLSAFSDVLQAYRPMVQGALSHEVVLLCTHGGEGLRKCENGQL